MRLPHSLFQPMAAEDVATAVADAALAAPLNGTVETAGPDTFHLDELVGQVLAYDKDPRKVVMDPKALYFGIEVNDQSLRPGPNPRLGKTRFELAHPLLDAVISHLVSVRDAKVQEARQSSASRPVSQDPITSRSMEPTHRCRSSRTEVSRVAAHS